MLFYIFDDVYDTSMKRFLGVLVGVIVTSACLAAGAFATDMPSVSPALDCRDIEFIFARGSGAEYQRSDMWLKYESEMSKLAQKLNYSARVTDVVYPAVSVTEPLTTALGAYISAGKYYEFGASVRDGVEWLRDYYRSVAKGCPDTKWVLAGYSQGAMVVSEAVKSFRHSNVIYVALFTDPQLYLPEGKGLFPDACSGKNMSEYRVYAPACRTYEGRLRARNPYVYGELDGKYGLWCGPNDYVCGSSNAPWSLSGHTKYVDRILQLTNILRSRIRREWIGNVEPLMAVATNDEPGAYALLSLDTYYVRPGELLSIDASESFSLDGEIVEYLWSFDGEEFWSSGTMSTIGKTFAAEGWHKITVRVVDSLGATAEYVSEISVTNDDVVDIVHTAPKNVTARREGDNIVLEWNGKTAPEPYTYLRINGYDLGFVLSEYGKATITDIDFNEKNTMQVAWMTGEMLIGEFLEIDLAEFGGSPPITSAPDTNVTFAEGILPCVLLVGCILGIRKILYA